MQRWIGTLILCASVLGLWAAGCGPSCKEAKSAISETDMAAEDAFRVNQLVSRRKMIIRECEGDVDEFTLKEGQFSVTAYELAIQMQLRIILMSPEGTQPTAAYGENLGFINDVRCQIDKVIDKKDPQITQMTASDIRGFHERFEKVFRDEDEPSVTMYKKYYEEGIKPAGK